MDTAGAFFAFGHFPAARAFLYLMPFSAFCPAQPGHLPAPRWRRAPSGPESMSSSHRSSPQSSPEKRRRFWPGLDPTGAAPPVASSLSPSPSVSPASPASARLPSPAPSLDCPCSLASAPFLPEFSLTCVGGELFFNGKPLGLLYVPPRAVVATYRFSDVVAAARARGCPGDVVDAVTLFADSRPGAARVALLAACLYYDTERANTEFPHCGIKRVQEAPAFCDEVERILLASVLWGHAPAAAVLHVAAAIAMAIGPLPTDCLETTALTVNGVIWVGLELQSRITTPWRLHARAPPSDGIGCLVPGTPGSPSHEACYRFPGGLVIPTAGSFYSGFCDTQSPGVSSWRGLLCLHKHGWAGHHGVFFGEWQLPPFLRSLIGGMRASARAESRDAMEALVEKVVFYFIFKAIRQFVQFELREGETDLLERLKAFFRDLLPAADVEDAAGSWFLSAAAIAAEEFFPSILLAAPPGGWFLEAKLRVPTDGSLAIPVICKHTRYPLDPLEIADAAFRAESSSWGDALDAYIKTAPDYALWAFAERFRGNADRCREAPVFVPRVLARLSARLGARLDAGGESVGAGGEPGGAGGEPGGAGGEPGGAGGEPGGAGGEPGGAGGAGGACCGPEY